MGSAKTRLKKKRKGGGPNLRWRMGFIAAVSVLVLLITSVRLVSIQGMDSMKLAEKALSNRLVTRTLPADRGQILAADGTVLADSVSATSSSSISRMSPSTKSTANSSEPGARPKRCRSR